mgnify:CR=1 FL=1
MLKKIWNKCWNFYHNKEEIFNYLISGFLGVIVSISSYSTCRFFNINILMSNIISWIIAVFFMYVTNKIFVFKSQTNSNYKLLQEFISFILARLFTLVVETLILFLCVNVIYINDIIAKVIAQVVIIILNYILSKFLIFKNSN